MTPKSNYSSKIKKFWKWFTENEERLYNFQNNQMRIFNETAKQLNKINRYLVFEFGVKEGGKREFVISANGMKEAFPAVEALYYSAPKLERWDFIKYRPRRDDIIDIQIADVKVKAGEVYFRLFPNYETHKIDIVLYLPVYSGEHKQIYENIALLFLDEALGEYDVETKIGYIEIDDRNAEDFKEAQPLKKLPQVFDELVNEFFIPDEN